MAVSYESDHEPILGIYNFLFSLPICTMFPLPSFEISVGEGSSPVASLHSLFNKTESFVAWI